MQDDERKKNSRVFFRPLHYSREAMSDNMAKGGATVGVEVESNRPDSGTYIHSINRSTIVQQITTKYKSCTIDQAYEIFDAINRLLGDVKTKLTTADHPMKGRVFTWGNIESFAEKCLMIAATPMINWDRLADEVESETGRSATTSQNSKDIRKPNEIIGGLEWITYDQKEDQFDILERTLPGSGAELRGWARNLKPNLRRRLKSQLRSSGRMVHNSLDLDMLIQQAMGYQTLVLKSGLVKQRLETTEEELMRNPLVTKELAAFWMKTWPDVRHAIEFDPNTGLITNLKQLQERSAELVSKCIAKANRLGCKVEGITNDTLFINRRRGALVHQNKCMIGMPPKTGKRTISANHPWVMTQDQMNLNDKKLGGLLLTGEPVEYCMIPEKLEYDHEPYRRREGFIYFMTHAVNIKPVERVNIYTAINNYHNEWLNHHCLFFNKFESVSTNCGFNEFDKHIEEYERNYQHRRDEYLACQPEVQEKMNKRFKPNRALEDPYRYRTASVLLQDDGGKTLLCKVFPDDLITATMLPESHTAVNDASYSHGVLNAVAYTQGLSTLHTGWPLKWEQGKPIFRDTSRCLMCPYKIDSMRPMPFHKSIDFGAEPVPWEKLVAWMIKVGVLDLTRANETWRANEHGCGNCGRVVGHWPPMAAYTPAHCTCGAPVWEEYRQGDSKELNHSLGIRTRWRQNRLTWTPKSFPDNETIEIKNPPINRHINTTRAIRGVSNTKPAVLNAQTNTYVQQPGGYRYPHESVKDLRDPDQTGIANTSTKWVEDTTIRDPHLESNIKWLEEQLRRVETEQNDCMCYCITATSTWQLGEMYTINLKAGSERRVVSNPNNRQETWYIPVPGGRSLATYRITPYFVNGLSKKWICHNGRDSSNDLDTSRLIGNLVAVNDNNTSGYDSFNCYYGPMLFMHWGKGSYLKDYSKLFMERMHVYSDIYCADEKLLIDAHQVTGTIIQGWQDIVITRGTYQASGHPRPWRSPAQLIRLYSGDRTLTEVSIPEVNYERMGITIAKALEEKDRD
nr:polyprotein [Alphaendornavirus sp.]